MEKAYKIHTKTDIKEKKLFNSQENEFQLMFFVAFCAKATGARSSIKVTEVEPRTKVMSGSDWKPL